MTWLITQDGVSSDPALESVFAVGNGYLGLRGTPDEGTPAHDAGAILNGFHETWPIVYPEDAYGLARTGQTIAAATDGTIIRLFVDDEPFDLATAKVHRFERVLDLRTGVLEREVEWETRRGQRILVRSKRLVSFEHRHLAAFDYEVTALDAAVRITLSSELVTHGPADTSDDPRRGKGFAEKVLVPVAARAEGARAVLRLATRNSGLELAVGMEHAVDAPARTTAEGDGARTVVLADLEAGEALRLEKYVAYHWAAGAPDLAARVERTLERAVRDGFETIEREHGGHVAAFWHRSDVEIEGAPEVQRAVRFNLFQLMQATVRAEGLGVAAKGVTGRGYEGHYFWDTEIYVVPFLIHTNPRWARQVLDFRCGMLGAARKRAAEVGHRGALYPWRTINGEEASAWYAAGTAQYHINADIAYAFRHYAWVTGDLGFLLGDGAQALVETARLWMELGFFSERHDGRFCINSVTGPDEYTTVVDNNAYTNLMAAENLEGAARVMQWLRGEDPDAFARLVRETGLTDAEIDGWLRAADLHVRPAPRGARHRAPGRRLPRAQAVGLRGHARQAPAAPAPPPARAVPPPGDQADRRRARHLPRRSPLRPGGDAAHVRLLRPADDRRLDAVGLRPERHRVGGRLPGAGARLLRAGRPGRPRRRARQHRRRHPRRLVRRHLARARRRLRRSARLRRRRTVLAAAAQRLGAHALPRPGPRPGRRGRDDAGRDELHADRGSRPARSSTSASSCGCCRASRCGGRSPWSCRRRHELAFRLVEAPERRD